MYDLNEMLAECLEECRACNIPVETISEITVNTRAKTRWGQCRKVSDGVYSINISYRLVDERSSRDGLKNTVLHELCHATKGGGGHKGKWAEYANILNNRYGYHITRCSSDSDKGVCNELSMAETRRDYKANYRFVCKDCGRVVTRMKKSGFVQNYKNYRCGRCGGMFRPLADWE